jgi:hypothetical protein
MPATVTYLKISHGIKHNTTYHVGYEYVLAGKALAADESVTDALYHSLHVGQAVPVRAVRLGPLHYVEMDNGDVRLFVVLGLAWNILFLLFLFAWVTLPRRLIRSGKPAWGQITGKRAENGSNVTSYCVEYRFQTPNRATRDWRMYVSRRFYDQAVVGADVVVLYDLKRDGSVQSLIYDFCDYIAG